MEKTLSAARRQVHQSLFRKQAVSLDDIVSRSEYSFSEQVDDMLNRMDLQKSPLRAVFGDYIRSYVGLMMKTKSEYGDSVNGAQSNYGNLTRIGGLIVAGGLTALVGGVVSYVVSSNLEYSANVAVNLGLGGIAFELLIKPVQRISNSIIKNRAYGRVQAKFERELSELNQQYDDKICSVKLKPFGVSASLRLT
ncbi:hypothetical protein HN587_04145 [Candidatus Woesearchaeota archaeon]|jgi:hypothetical protein|nr:hypothetical protein [Candidatus Woesearchaeota archaeon]